MQKNQNKLGINSLNLQKELWRDICNLRILQRLFILIFTDIVVVSMLGTHRSAVFGDIRDCTGIIQSAFVKAANQ